MLRWTRLRSASPLLKGSPFYCGGAGRSADKFKFSIFRGQGEFYTARADDSACKSKKEESVVPITVDEFRRVLEKVCRPHHLAQGPLHLALAVSGGVDSMCLAHLAQGLQAQQSNLYRFVALVVDHKARPESTQEALETERSLKDMGLATSVLELQWPGSAQPLEQSNFETEARRLRYRAMGRICSELDIHHLLLAHHDDDQAETVLGRIVQGYIGRGLTAMALQARISECHGVPGVDESPQSWTSKERGIASSGVSIVRPLLGFSKLRLRLTCQACGVSWKEDKTNDDVTLTMRNTIRHLLRSRKLPVALRKESLLSMSKAVAKRIEEQQSAATGILRRFNILKLDLRSGKLDMSFFPERLFPGFSTMDASARREAIEIMATALMPIARAVSPLEKIQYGQILPIAEHLLPSQSSDGTGLVQGDSDLNVSAFTRAGTHWQKGLSPRDREEIWTLNRQPYNLKNIPASDAAVRPRCIWGGAMQEGVPYGTWQLYDGRFWICITKASFEAVVVRPLEPSDKKTIAGLRDAGTRLKALKRLNVAAPHKCRWTLPVMAEPTTGRVLALPTLGLRLITGDQGVLSWDVQYKHLDERYWQSLQLIPIPLLGMKKEFHRSAKDCL